LNPIGFIFTTKLISSLPLAISYSEGPQPEFAINYLQVGALMKHNTGWKILTRKFWSAAKSVQNIASADSEGA
jgi:hypothetical protein